MSDTHRRPRRPRPARARPVLLAAAACALSLALYWADVPDNPPGFYIDESSIAYNAHAVSQTGKDETVGRLRPGGRARAPDLPLLSRAFARPAARRRPRLLPHPAQRLARRPDVGTLRAHTPAAARLRPAQPRRADRQVQAAHLRH